MTSHKTSVYTPRSVCCCPRVQGFLLTWTSLSWPGWAHRHLLPAAWVEGTMPALLWACSSSSMSAGALFSGPQQSPSETEVCQAQWSHQLAAPLFILLGLRIVRGGLYWATEASSKTRGGWLGWRLAPLATHPPEKAAACFYA